jgi:CheY-like chemotaxis protein
MVASTLRSLPDPQRAKPCILVVDDDDVVMAGIAARLGPDFRVIGVTDPKLAVDMALDEMPDVILCDINMPEMKGDEVAYAMSLEEGTVDIPLVYLTSLMDPNDAEELGGTFGEHMAISKGASTEELKALLYELLNLPSED